MIFFFLWFPWFAILKIVLGWSDGPFGPASEQPERPIEQSRMAKVSRLRALPHQHGCFQTRSTWGVECLLTPNCSLFDHSFLGHSKGVLAAPVWPCPLWNKQNKSQIILRYCFTSNKFRTAWGAPVHCEPMYNLHDSHVITSTIVYYL